MPAHEILETSVPGTIVGARAGLRSKCMIRSAPGPQADARSSLQPESIAADRTRS
jgi:hypothetical protein